MDNQEPFVGQIRNKDRVLKMFSKPRGLDEGVWTEIANFSLHLRFHSANKVPNEGRFYIFEGQVCMCTELYLHKSYCSPSEKKINNILNHFDYNSGGFLKSCLDGLLRYGILTNLSWEP